MNSWERFKRMYEHREADRIPIIDNPWTGTIRRWRNEGMPADADWRDYFGVDKQSVINVVSSPRDSGNIPMLPLNARSVQISFVLSIAES